MPARYHKGRSGKDKTAHATKAPEKKKAPRFPAGP
jgi:hypothetical protein